VTRCVEETARNDPRMHRLLLAFTLTALALGAACKEQWVPVEKKGEAWKPGVTYRSDVEAPRGFLDVRGLIHAHSVYSHDACDEAPVLEDGTRDPVCFDDFRRGLCQSKHDFVFLTDHRESFDSTEFPDTLLYKPERGDVLVERNGGPTANRITCDDGGEALIMAGNEGGMMPVGFEGHAAPAGERGDLYGARTPEAAQQMRDHGAVVLLAHPEDFTPDELFALPVDGFEMYNLHANTFLGAGTALDVLLRWQDGDTGIAVPDLLVAQIWSEDEKYLSRWGRVLARGKRVVSTMGTDCHRNTFATIMEDGERADSYRRMMIAFSNHLRIRPNADGTFDDANLKEALAAARNYGVFEMWGYPRGFDARADKDGATYEMGETVPVGATLVVTKPTLEKLDSSREKPALTLRIVKAVDDAAGFVEVAHGDGDTLDAVLAEPGVYRAEVRIMPWHLREDMRDDAFTLLDDFSASGKTYVWIYGGTCYVE
jgi:hypothetical protein